jgi:ankyrin repeat protein
VPKQIYSGFWLVMDLCSSVEEFIEERHMQRLSLTGFFELAAEISIWLPTIKIVRTDGPKVGEELQNTWAESFREATAMGVNAGNDQEALRQAIGYVMRACMNAYTEHCTFYRDLNRVLREQRDVESPLWPPFIELLNECLERWVQPAGADGTTLYRGSPLPLEVLEEYEKAEGEWIAFAAFTSMSENRDIAVEFSKPQAGSTDPTVIYVTKTSGRPRISDVSLYGREEEELLHEGSCAKITKVTRGEPGVTPWTIELEDSYLNAEWRPAKPTDTVTITLPGGNRPNVTVFVGGWGTRKAHQPALPLDKLRAVARPAARPAPVADVDVSPAAENVEFADEPEPEVAVELAEEPEPPAAIEFAEEPEPVVPVELTEEPEPAAAIEFAEEDADADAGKLFGAAVSAPLGLLAASMEQRDGEPPQPDEPKAEVVIAEELPQAVSEAPKLGGLHAAALLGNIAALAQAIKNGENINQRDEQGRIPLHLAAAQRNDKVVGVLLRAGSEKDAKDNRGWTPLHCAVRDARFGSIRRLTAHGANVNAQDEEGRAPLHLAVVGGNAEIVKVLVAHGANDKLKDKDGNTALHYAAAGGNAQMLDVLVRPGMNIDIKNKSGATPLITAASNGHRDFSARLLQSQAKCDVNARTRRGFTALLAALEGGHEEVATYLLGMNADANARTTDGRTARQIATEGGMTTVLARLADGRAFMSGVAPSGSRARR